MPTARPTMWRRSRARRQNWPPGSVWRLPGSTVDSANSRCGGLPPPQTAPVASTERLGSPTLGELACLESVQPPSMTRIIAALEKLGLVVRVVDPTDRRVARVRVSEAGREVLEQNRSLKNVFLALQLQSLTSDERDALGGLTALIERLAEGLEPRAPFVTTETSNFI